MGGAVTDLPNRVLSIRAPWAWSILHWGKTIENRELSFPRSFTGEFWLHVGLWPGTRKPLTMAQHIDMADLIREAKGHAVGHSTQDTLGLFAMRGCIVGRVTLTRYVESSPSPWFITGKLGLVLENPIALRQYVPAVGSQGWWFAKPDVLGQLREAA